MGFMDTYVALNIVTSCSANLQVQDPNSFSGAYFLPNTRCPNDVYEFVAYV